MNTKLDVFCRPEDFGRAAGEPPRGSSEAAEPPPGRDRGQAEDAGRADGVRSRPNATQLLDRRRAVLTGCCADLSLNQGLLLEQGRLMSDFNKLKDKEQEQDAKLQKLM